MKRMIGVALLLSLLLAGGLAAQTASGTILGTVRDATGAVVAGASIAIVNQETGLRRELASGSGGEYEAPNLPLGPYAVTVKVSGFKTVERSGVTLLVDQKARLDFTLQVGDVAETVNVVEQAPLIKSSSSELGETVLPRVVRELPLNGRNYVQLVHLTAGVTTGQQGGNIEGAGAFVPRGTGSFNANGHRGQNNNFLIDGIDNNESWINTTILQPPIEAIQEFKVYTANFPAELGRATGGVVNVQVRSGTNDLHGSAYDYLRNSALDARNFFDRRTAVNERRLPNFVQNQFGATAGGPIKRNDWFFFTDYQGMRQRLGLSVVTTVPSTAQKSGDFGATRIFDPVTTRPDPADPTRFLRTQFENNRIPAARIPRPSQNLLLLYPAPNVAGVTNNHFFGPSLGRNDNQFDVRSDKIVTSRNNLFLRVSYGVTDTALPGAIPAPAGLPFTTGQYVASDTGQRADGADFRLASWGGALSDTHIFRPSLINEFRVGFSRFDLNALPADMSLPVGTAVGIRGTSEVIPPFSGGLPGVRPSGFAMLGVNTPIPSIFQNTNYQLDQNVTWLRGRHSTKFGFHVIRRHQNLYEAQPPGRGFFDFSPDFTNLPGAAGTGNSMASLLLGYPSRITRDILFGSFGLRAWEWAWFVQDDFKLTPRLTLNLGLRYELFPPLTEAGDRIVNFNFDRSAPALNLFANRNGVNQYAGRSVDKSNWGPRFGFAYDVFGGGRTVVRGGYGISYDSVHYAGQGGLGRNAPFEPSQDFNPGSLNVGLNLSDGVPVPAFVALSDTATLNRVGGSIRTVDLDTRIASAQHWSLNVQQEVRRGLVAEAAYVGTRGLHLFSNYNLNQPDPGPGGLGPRRPFRQLPNVATISFTGYFGASTYHAAQFKVTQHIASGFELLAVYTVAKSIDDAISGSSGQRNRNGGYQDINNRRASRAASTFDVPQRFVASALYELPVGKGKRWGSDLAPALDRLIGGWQLNTITTLQGGFPFTPTLAANGLNNGNWQLPNRVGNGAIPAAERRPQRWFNTSIDPRDSGRAFEAPAPFQFGNSGINILRGPGLATVDFSLFKNIPVRERMKVQLRMEAFNFFNRANFALPIFNLGLATAGTINQTVTTSRQIQVVGKFEF